MITQIRKFRGESKFSTWVGAIAKNKWRDHIKRVIRERELFADPRYIQHDDPWEDADAERPLEMYEPLALGEFNRKEKDLLEVEEVEAHLGAGERAVYEAVFVGGNTNREAAQMLGKSEHAVESQAGRLRKRLRARQRNVA